MRPGVEEPAGPQAEEILPTPVKAGYALGDHTVNIQLATVSLFFLYFLTEVAGLPPSLAGLVLLAGRAVDAFTDPLMGRLSDRTRLRWGRRRPYFLLGALPYGVTFALLWSSSGLSEPLAIFVFYTAVYVANTLCSTVLAVPYMALLPELAVGYHERTSLNTFRTVGVVLAILIAAAGSISWRTPLRPPAFRPSGPRAFSPIAVRTKEGQTRVTASPSRACSARSEPKKPCRACLLAA